MLCNTKRLPKFVYVNAIELSTQTRGVRKSKWYLRDDFQRKHFM